MKCLWDIRWVTYLCGVKGQGAEGYGTAGEDRGLVCCEPALLAGGLGCCRLHVVPVSSRCHSDRCMAVINTLSDFFSSHPRFLILSLLPFCLSLRVPHCFLTLLHLPFHSLWTHIRDPRAKLLLLTVFLTPVKKQQQLKSQKKKKKI